MSKKLRLLELRIDPEKGSLVSGIALVGKPAIGSNFLAFSNEEPKATEIKFAMNEERMELLGAAMIPGLPMYRDTPGIGEYLSVFDAQTIRQIAQVFAEKGFFNSVNLDHTDTHAGSYVFQSYIVDPERGLNAPIGVDAPAGSWIIGVKVNDPIVWQDIKDGKRNGFSVEGFFNMFDTSIEVELAEMERLANEFEAEIDAYLAEAKGCLMFFPDVNIKDWEFGVRRLVPGAKDLELEPHVTILYGLMHTPEIIPQLQSILSASLNDWPIDIELGRISKFTNDSGDVIKIDIWDVNGALNGLNMVLTDVFGVISKFPHYRPHMTIAYTDTDPTVMYSSERVWPYEFGLNSLNKGRIVYSDGLGGQFDIAVIK